MKLAPRPSSRSTSAAMSSDRKSRWTRFFDRFGSGTFWNRIGTRPISRSFGPSATYCSFTSCRS